MTRSALWSNKENRLISCQPPKCKELLAEPIFQFLYVKRRKNSFFSFVNVLYTEIILQKWLSSLDIPFIMGIKGLLGFLSGITKNCHLRELRGSTLGIDVSCLLYKGAYNCAEKICLGLDTTE